MVIFVISFNGFSIVIGSVFDGCVFGKGILIRGFFSCWISWCIGCSISVSCYFISCCIIVISCCYECIGFGIIFS